MVPASRTCSPPLLLSALLFFLGVLPAPAQWAVYDMRMNVDDSSSVNFVHYSGSYLIAPLGGGPASMVFTTEQDGRYYAVARNAATFFMASSANARRAVVSATAASGTSHSMYLASGALDNTRSYMIRGQKSVAIIASQLSGQLMTADDEHLLLAPTTDQGVVGVTTFKGFFRKDLADRMDAAAPTMDQAVDVITALLEKYGYQSEADAPSTTATPNTSAAPVAPAPIPADVPGGAESTLFPPGSASDNAANSSPFTTK